jgi:hypothetical protein
LQDTSVTEFLSSLQDRFNGFKSLGWYDLNHVDRMLPILKKVRQGVQPTKFGGIVNLGGIHYVVVFLNVKARSVEYFDSLEDMPPGSVSAFLNKAKEHLETKHRVPFRLRTPTRRH